MEILDYTFFRNALIGVLVISIAAGIIGTYIITRRMVSITGGITHACFGGLGLGYYLGVSPIAMAAAVAIASSLGVEWMSSRHHVREDSAIAVVWSFGMALGILFVFLTPGYAPELNSFLFGDILTITTGDLTAFGAFTAVLAAIFAFGHRTIVICAFDRDFARVSGLPVNAVSCLMTVMVAICVVLTIRLIGIMLLISMLTLPVLVAEIWCQRYRTIMLVAMAISAVSSVGSLLAATVIDVPCSAIIVLIQVGIYALALATHQLLSIRR